MWCNLGVECRHYPVFINWSFCYLCSQNKRIFFLCSDISTRSRKPIRYFCSNNFYFPIEPLAISYSVKSSFNKIDSKASTDFCLKKCLNHTIILFRTYSDYSRSKINGSNSFQPLNKNNHARNKLLSLAEAEELQEFLFL